MDELRRTDCKDTQSYLETNNDFPVGASCVLSKVTECKRELSTSTRTFQSRWVRRHLLPMLPKEFQPSVQMDATRVVSFSQNK